LPVTVLERDRIPMTQKSEYTVQSLVDTAYDYYKSYYDDPRSIHYATLSSELDTDAMPVLDYVAEALNLGCKDTQNDNNCRSKDEMIEAIGHPTDSWWDIVADE